MRESDLEERRAGGSPGLGSPGTQVRWPDVGGDMQECPSGRSNMYTTSTTPVTFALFPRSLRHFFLMKDDMVVRNKVSEVASWAD